MVRTRKNWPKCPGVLIRGRIFRQSDLVLIRDIIRRHPTWGRTKISQRVCKTLCWHQANGFPKDRACRIALVRLEQAGYLDLPPPRRCNSGGKPPSIHTAHEHAFPGPVVQEMPRAIEFRCVSTAAEARLWNSTIARYHYLGSVWPVGRLIRYLLYAEEELVGAMSFTNATWSSEARSIALTSIGLDSSPAPEFVVSNNRFLLLPNVRVKNLASHVLSKAIRHVRVDWYSRYRYSPLLAETFVDPARFSGTSYLAANWLHIGMTKGYSKRGQRHYRNHQRKMILLRGICPQVHQRLHAIYGASNGR